MREITIGYSCIEHGNMDTRFGGQKEVLNNMEAYLYFLGLSIEKTAFMNTQHGDTIEEVTKDNLKDLPMDGFLCDGLFTTDKDITLAFPLADCLAISFWNENFSAIIHVGRGGILNKIIHKAIGIFLIRGLIGSKNKVKVMISPYVKKCCYVFPIEPFYFTKYFQKLYKYLEFSDNDDFCLDLGAAAKDVFSSYASLIEGEVGIIEQCTCCAKNDNNKRIYFSHVNSNEKRFFGDSPEGRNLAVIKRN
jgi:copper oxidase (laccase) domain-containing protein